MALPAIEVDDRFPGERDALLEILADLEPDEWFAPTACAGWSVHDLALHLLGADVNILSGDRDRFGGPPGSGPKSDLAVWVNLVEYINQRNEAWVAALRRISPALVQELLGFTGVRVAAYFGSVDLHALGNPVNWAGPERAPVWLHVAREYTERWTHQQHIRDAVGRPGLTDPYWLSPVLDAFARALPHTLRNVAAVSGDTVGLRVTGDAGGEWWAVRDDAGWDLQPMPAARVLAVVTLDADTAWRRFTHGISFEEAAGKATIEGNSAIGRTVLNMVSIIA